MSMGAAANVAWVIKESAVKKFCSKELKFFMGLVDGCELNLEEFAKNAECNDLSGYDKDLIEAYKNLCSVFKNKTGIAIGLAYHNHEDEGDIYDQVDGIFWYVIGGLYQLTPSGKKMKRYIDERLWVVHA